MRAKKRTWKIVSGIATSAAAVVLMVRVTTSAPAAPGGVSSVEISAVESIEFDGSTLSAKYRVQSACPANKHSARVKFNAITEPYRRAEKIVALETVLIDEADESACGGEAGVVFVSANLDVATAAREELSTLVGKGYMADPDYVLALPPAWPATGDLETADSANKEVKFLKQDGKGLCPKTTTAAPAPAAAAPSTVKLTTVNYVPHWTCVLDKKSSASRNSFTGTGVSEAAARSDAMMGCMRTNEPKCGLMSVDPAHTSCSAEIKEEKTLREFTAAMAADGGNYLVAEITGQNAQWACTLYKNDGARKDGFTGRGDTLDEARNNAASGCARTNHPKCREWAYDPSHTACLMEMK